MKSIFKGQNEIKEKRWFTVFSDDSPVNIGVLTCYFYVVIILNFGQISRFWVFRARCLLSKFRIIACFIWNGSSLGFRRFRIVANFLRLWDGSSLRYTGVWPFWIVTSFLWLWDGSSLWLRRFWIVTNMVRWLLSIEWTRSRARSSFYFFDRTEGFNHLLWFFLGRFSSDFGP